MGRYLMQGLGRLQERFPAVREVRGRGLLIGMEMDRLVAPLVDFCRDASLLILTAGERIIRLAPALIVGEAECDRALEILQRALAQTRS